MWLKNMFITNYACKGRDIVFDIATAYVLDC
jgi:hypothetical protein